MKGALKGAVRFEKRTAANGRTVAVLTMDNAPVNALSSGVRAGLDEHLKAIQADSAIAAVVITGAHGSFCAGADISEFSKGFQGPNLGEVIDAIEASAKPVVAAIDGVSLGGGCEVALACHYRLASTRARAGLPEVNLGLLPGAGGTQRLPRLIGAEASIDFMCGGLPVSAQKAVQLGVYDQVVQGDNAAVLKAAVDFAAEKVGSDLGPRRLSTVAVKAPAAGAVEAKKKQFAKLRAGEVAPQAIIKCVEAAVSQPFAQSIQVEQSEFFQLLVGDQSRALQYMFFAERACAKIPGLTAAPGPLNHVGIIGAGLMGGGIAMCCAEAGMQVTLLDISQEALDKGLAVIRKNYAQSVQRKSKTQADVDKLLARISGTTSYESFAPCDLIVEAVFENMKVKKEIFATLDRVCKPGAILASNTSALNIDEIASATKRPEDVVGCHFFSPANVMKLLENVRGSKSSPRTLATAMEFGRKIGKITCLVGNCPGFIANRVMGVSGSQKLLHSGILPHEIDAAAEAFGMRMGPFRMMDLVGLDLFGRERQHSKVADPAKNAADAMFARGRFGQKNGKGFYVYNEKRQHSRDPEAEKIIAEIWQNTGVSPRKATAEEIVEELYFPVINEGFKCLEEGMAIRPSDIDVCLVFGYNWPRFRGGPMQYATAVGLPKVLERLEELKIKPSNLLRECVEKGWSLNSKELQKRLEAASKL